MKQVKSIHTTHLQWRGGGQKCDGYYNIGSWDITSVHVCLHLRKPSKTHHSEGQYALKNPSRYLFFIHKQQPLQHQIQTFAYSSSLLFTSSQYHSSGHKRNHFHVLLSLLLGYFSCPNHDFCLYIYECLKLYHPGSGNEVDKSISSSGHSLPHLCLSLLH